MKRALAVLLLCLFCVSAAEPDFPQFNFLFVVDTSISMASRKASAVGIIRELVSSGFQGQIAEGDSIDIWTCDTETHLAGFPPQIWDTNRIDRIASAASSYIERQKFRGRSRFISMANDLNSLLPNTKGLMVILITDGEEPVSGTGFDGDINADLPRLRRKLQNPKQAFVIALSAVNGRFTDWRIFAGAGRPPLPLLPKRTKPEPPQRVAEAVEPQAKIPEPAKKPEPERPVIVEFPPGARITPAAPASAADGQRQAGAPEPETPNQATAALREPEKPDQTAPAVATSESSPRPGANEPARPVAKSRGNNGLQEDIAPVPRNESPKETPPQSAAPPEKKAAPESSSAQTGPSRIERAAPDAPADQDKPAAVAQTNHSPQAQAVSASVPPEPPVPNSAANANAKFPAVAVGITEPSLKPFYIAAGAGGLLLLVGITLWARKRKHPEPSLISKSFDQ